MIYYAVITKYYFRYMTSIKKNYKCPYMFAFLLFHVIQRQILSARCSDAYSMSAIME